MLQTFNCLPSVQFLETLVKNSGSLKDHLPKAVRLWVILRSIYGSDRLALGESFTYNQWRDQFFKLPQQRGKASEKVFHKNRDKNTLDHCDPDCPCAKTLADWLFYGDFGAEAKEWKEDFSIAYNLQEEQINNILSLASLNGRLFAVTGKNIQDNDFKKLVKLKWLESSQAQKELYYKVTKFPLTTNSTPQKNNDQQIDTVLKQTELAEIVTDYSQPLKGIQRFLMHANYVVSKEGIDRISDCNEQLKKIWQQEDFAPIEITYDSASLYKEVTRIIYPVCIYYYERAPYLCGFGQTPKKSQDIDWHNYRLDRVLALTQEAWNSEKIPQHLKQLRETHNLPCPETIEKLMCEAWGFDFYRESDLLLLRFNNYFHENYIQNTFRHDTFKPIPSLREVIKKIKDAKFSDEQKTTLIDHINQYPEDAYYQARYRVGDNNIIMRLRSWGPNVEVLLPFSLRQKMTEDLNQSLQMYK